MRFRDLRATLLTRALVSLQFVNLLAQGQSLQPKQCVTPTVSRPAAFVQTPLTVSLPAATTINVRTSGASGNGTTIDSDAIQSMINSNPNSTIYFPTGLYRLHNLGKPGLEFANFHGSVIMQNGARFLCDTIATATAGTCIRFVNASNVTVGNVRVGYIGDSALPFVRDNAGNTAMLVENSQNVVLTNTTIEHSPGPGIWVNNSSNIQFLGGTSVSDTTADGLHFENVGSAVVDNFFAQNTGDDSLEWNNTSTGTALCGLTATNLQIYRSLSSGIAVRGGCGATFSNFFIDTTANSGMIVAQDPNFGTLVPRNSTFNNGTALNSGRLSSPTVSGKNCIDVATSTGTSFNNVSCVYPLIHGALVDGNASAVTLNNVTVDSAPGVGFAFSSASNVWLTNTISRGSLGGGYVFINTAAGSVSGAYACNSGAYGYYHGQTTGLAESSLTSYDSSAGNSSNRAWWAENSSSRISVNGLALIDDVVRNPIVVGEVGDSGTIVFNGVTVSSPYTSYTIQKN